MKMILTELNKILLYLIIIFLIPFISVAESPKWKSASIFFMMQECYNTINNAVIKKFGTPVIPYIGINQCSCMNDKIRINYPLESEYRKLTVKQIENLIMKYTGDCIVEGAMGPDAKRAYEEGQKNEKAGKKSESSRSNDWGVMNTPNPLLIK